MNVRIPAHLSGDGSGMKEVDVPPGTLESVLAALDRRYPGLNEKLLDTNGDVRRYVNIFVNGTDSRFEGGLQMAVDEHDEVVILPAMSGGSLTAD